MKPAFRRTTGHSSFVLESADPSQTPQLPSSVFTWMLDVGCWMLDVPSEARHQQQVGHVHLDLLTAFIPLPSAFTH